MKNQYEKGWVAGFERGYVRGVLDFTRDVDKKGVQQCATEEAEKELTNMVAKERLCPECKARCDWESTEAFAVSDDGVRTPIGGPPEYWLECSKCGWMGTPKTKEEKEGGSYGR